MKQRSRLLNFAQLAALVAADSLAQVPAAAAPQGAASSPLPVSQRRNDVRQAVVSQRSAQYPVALDGRRLSEQEKAELRQQIRLQGLASAPAGH